MIPIIPDIHRTKNALMRRRDVIAAGEALYAWLDKNEAHRVEISIFGHTTFLVDLYGLSPRHISSYDESLSVAIVDGLDFWSRLYD